MYRILIFTECKCRIMFIMFVNAISSISSTDSVRPVIFIWSSDVDFGKKFQLSSCIILHSSFHGFLLLLLLIPFLFSFPSLSIFVSLTVSLIWREGKRHSNLRGMTGKLGEASERGYVLRGRIKWAWQCKRGDRRWSNIQTSPFV